MSNHTPGPWSAATYRHMSIICSVGGVKHICQVFNDGHGASEPELEEGMANANLIVAAPEMLEALKEVPIVSKFKTAEDFIHAFHEWCDVYKLPAIAKAEGDV